MTNKNLLLFGSESQVCKDYVMRYKDCYENIVGIDLPSESSYLKTYLSVDYRSEESFKKIELFLVDQNKTYSHVVFAAGINFLNDSFGITEQEWNMTFDVNVKAALFSLKVSFNYFMKKTAIVLIASQNGVVAHERRIDYGTSKAALIHLAKNLSLDYAKLTDKDIRINTISPSYIKTDNNKELLDSYIGKRLLARIPYHKFISLEDVSNSIHFLLSDYSQSIRGHNLILDNGYTIV